MLKVIIGSLPWGGAKSWVQLLGILVRSGAVMYERMHATINSLQPQIASWTQVLRYAESRVDWQVNVPSGTPKNCYHGGELFKAIGESFDTRDRHRQVINANVFEAWFDPLPKVLQALQEHLPWLLRTSPPTHCEGLIIRSVKLAASPRHISDQRPDRRIWYTASFDIDSDPPRSP